MVCFEGNSRDTIRANYGSKMAVVLGLFPRSIIFCDDALWLRCGCSHMTLAYKCFTQELLFPLSLAAEDGKHDLNWRQQAFCQSMVYMLGLGVGKPECQCGNHLIQSPDSESAWSVVILRSVSRCGSKQSASRQYKEIDCTYSCYCFDALSVSLFAWLLFDV